MKLPDHPFFRETANDQVQGLIERTEVAEYQADEWIFHEGNPSDTLCLVLTGEVAFVKDLPDGKHRVISKAGEGSFFGEVGIFTGAPRSLSARADRPVTIGKISRENLVGFIKSTPGPIEQILGSIVRHLHHTTQHYIDDMLHQEKMSLVGTMVNTIIHDFKNPFTLISLGSQLLQSRHGDDPKTLKICKNIEAQVTRMVEMASELSEYSKGEQRMNFKPVNLEELCASFRELNDPYFNKDNVQIDIQTEPVVIQAERGKLLRVLQNLVGNAIEALSEERTDGRVSIRIWSDADDAFIEIDDNGGGIPEQIQSTFFDPFVTFGKSGGTGLGTAIVKSIIDAHNGRIDFVSGPETGTTFTIRLPKVQVPQEAEAVTR